MPPLLLMERKRFSVKVTSLRNLVQKNVGERMNNSNHPSRYTYREQKQPSQDKATIQQYTETLVLPTMGLLMRTYTQGGRARDPACLMVKFFYYVPLGSRHNVFPGVGPTLESPGQELGQHRESRRKWWSAWWLKKKERLQKRGKRHKPARKESIAACASPP